MVELHPEQLAEKNATLLTSKMTTTVLNDGVRASHGVNADGFLMQVGKVLGFGEAAGQVMLFGLVAVISAAVTQLEHRHKVGNVLDMYRDSLAARLGKPAHTLVAKDLDTAAKDNTALADELKKLRSQRTVGVLLSMAASVTALATVTAIIAMPALAPLTAPLSGLLMGAPMLLVEGLMGVAVYHTVKTPLKAMAHGVLGLDKETTHDRIAKLEHAHALGKVVSREQVLDLFTRGNPQIDPRVLSTSVPVDALTDGINKGTIKIPELVFAVHPGNAAQMASHRPMAQEWANHPADQRRPGMSFVQQVGKTPAPQPQLVQR